MEHRRLTVAYLWIDGAELHIKYASVLAVRNPGSADLDWECVAYALDADAPPFDQGAYALRATTIEGPTVHGDAVLVRSVRGSHVWRGAGPLYGVEVDGGTDSGGTDSGGADEPVVDVDP